MKVFKYELNEVGETLVDIPMGAMRLHLALQKGKPHLWLAVDPNMPLRRSKIVVVPTGSEVPRHAEYLGTLLYNGGDFVAHFFEVPS